MKKSIQNTHIISNFKMYRNFGHTKGLKQDENDIKKIKNLKIPFSFKNITVKEPHLQKKVEFSRKDLTNPLGEYT